MGSMMPCWRIIVLSFSATAIAMIRNADSLRRIYPVDAKWGRFPICPEMSRFVPVLSFSVLFGGPERGQIGTKEDKRGQNGDKLGNAPFSIYPYSALLKQCTTASQRRSLANFELPKGLGPPAPRVAAVKELYLAHSRKRRFSLETEETENP